MKAFLDKVFRTSCDKMPSIMTLHNFLDSLISIFTMHVENKKFKDGRASQFADFVVTIMDNMIQGKYSR